MKKATLIVLMCVCAATSQAQHFEFGLSGGMVSNAVHDMNNGISYTGFEQFQSRVVSPVISGRAMLVTSHFQFGMGLESKTYAYKGVQYPDAPLAINYPETRYKSSDLLFQLMANYVLHFKHVDAYGGVAIEVISANTTASTMSYQGIETYQKETGTRVGTDLHVGATYFVTKHIGINAEVRCENNSFPAGPFDKDIVSFPVTAGVRYRL